MITKFNIIGMSCASCQSHIESYVSNQLGIINVNVDLIKSLMIVEYDDKLINENDIKRYVKLSGYLAENINQNLNKNDDKKKLIKLIISGICLILLMDISMGRMINLPLSSFIYSKGIIYPIIQLILLLPIIIIYFNIYISGITKIIKLHPNMDSLISLGSIASISYGIYGLIKIILGDNSYMNNFYFESAGMILVMVNFGKFLESKQFKKTQKEIEKLYDGYPKNCYIKKDNDSLLINIDDLKIDDIVIIKEGEMIPSDGIVLNGNGFINEASITGESKEKYVEKDIEVLSGTYLVSGYLEVKVLKLPKDSTFLKILELVEEASVSKAKVSYLVDKISLYFVPIIVIISILTFIINNLVLKDFNIAFNNAVSVLVISCPCSLGLATPVAVCVAAGKASSMGILVKNAEILENLNHINTIAFDKTGTLTKGNLEVKEVITYDNTYNVLNIAYSLEEKNPHSLSIAICKYAKKRYASILEVDNYEYLIGLGVSGKIGNESCFVGNIKYFKDQIDEKINNKYLSSASIGEIPLLVIVNNKIIGMIILQDEIKEEAYDLINKLKERNIRTVLLTGDNDLNAKFVSSNLGINEYHSNMLPIEKQEYINNLKNNSLVAMVGDGVNDAPSLKLASVGISVNSASYISLESSDVILLNENIFDLFNAIMLSKKTFNIIKGNLFWALFYNLFAVLTATGLFQFINLSLNPMIASICMSVSSVFVVFNSLRINRFKKIKVTYQNTKYMSLKVNGMMCEHCEEKVKKVVLQDSNVVLCNASYQTGLLEIEYRHEINLKEINNNLEKIGYKII